MASFRQKKISRSQTLADKLKKTRLEKEKTLEEVAEATKIQIKYLEILEEGDYHRLPGDIYSKAWLRLYGDFLGLETSELLADFKIEKTISEKLKKASSPVVKKDNSTISNILKPKVLKYFGIGVLVLIIFSYIGFEINKTISPPEVTIFEPDNNFKTSDSSVTIKGQTKPEVQLTINNELVLLDKEGNFSQAINLVNGLNNLEINAKKKHSKTKTIEIIIFRESLE